VLNEGERWQLEEGDQVAVLGGGLMGHALAAIFLSRGYLVTGVESDDTSRAALASRVDKVVAQLPRSATTGALHVVAAPSELGPDTRLVIEAVPEVLELKRDLMSHVAAACPLAVLATNTSVFRVGDVAERVADRSRVVGTHWWNPPHLIPLVEVVEGAETSAAVVEGMMRLLTSLGKSPVHVRRDTPGFIGNRLQHALWREAMALVQEGVCDAHDVDVVVRTSIGLKLSAVGPLENADYVGLDLTRAIHEYVFPALSTAQQPLDILEEAVARGHLGAKTRRGLLTWPEGAREATSRRLDERVRLLTSLLESDSLTTPTL
jgi:3-hydroxybutyryl-CoA dehydrogenase